MSVLEQHPDNTLITPPEPLSGLEIVPDIQTSILSIVPTLSQARASVEVANGVDGRLLKGFNLDTILNFADRSIS